MGFKFINEIKICVIFCILFVLLFWNYKKYWLYLYIYMIKCKILFYLEKIENLRLIWEELLNIIYICFVVVIVFVFFVLLMCIIYKKYMWVFYKFNEF